ncbi:MAG: hypothetical protein KC646_01045 [Candidatus Cloacimonetes bacterium]|nr:hypothetical protein [Candidatus Cloacimonadota bacterium]
MTDVNQSNHPEIVAILNMMDYQHLVDWINESAKVHSQINDLNDKDFNRLSTHLVQSITYLIVTNLSEFVEDVSDPKIQTKLQKNIDDLKEFSCVQLQGEQVYHLISLWSTMRRELLSDLGAIQ